MAKSHQTFNKKNKEEKRKKKKVEKEERRKQRKLEKAAAGPKSFEDNLSYIDENGNLSSTPPDPTKKIEINAEDIVLGVPSREPVIEEKVKSGKVKFYNNEKGYGFITDAKTGDNVFVHVKNILEPIKENDKVVYEMGQGPKGPTAINVMLASS